MKNGEDLSQWSKKKFKLAEVGRLCGSVGHQGLRHPGGPRALPDSVTALQCQLSLIRLPPFGLSVMGTSPQDNAAVVVGSPVSLHNHSPVRQRRSSSASVSHDDPSRAATLARHSPTLVRSFNPNDPDVRERQRTMDVDMAMQLSRARRPTISNTSPYESQPPSLHRERTIQYSPERPVFPTMIDEEEDMNYHEERRSQEDLRGLGMDLHDMDGGEDGETLVPRRARSDPSLHHAPVHHTPNVLDGADPSSSRYGLPTYQPNTSRSNFDFSRMEDFAAVEKATLGLGSPITPRMGIPGQGGERFSSIPVREMGGDLGEQHPPPEGLAPGMNVSTSSTASQIRISISDDHMQPQASAEDNGAEPAARPLRHRKISQSNSARPRPPRKGIGGKISLFESAPTEPVPRLPPLLSSSLATSSGLNPYSDFVINATGGAPPHGALHPTTPGQGHDRPYRFSFYSNSLSHTIHARSLSELPAEGQSFEDLFAGHQPTAPPPPFQSSNGVDNVMKDRPASSLAFTPPPAPPPGYLGHRASPSDGASVYANSSRRVPIDNKPAELAHNESDNTWWLDVMCPTDEEMKMLSKVGPAWIAMRFGILVLTPFNLG